MWSSIEGEGVIEKLKTSLTQVGVNNALNQKTTSGGEESTLQSGRLRWFSYKKPLQLEVVWREAGVVDNHREVQFVEKQCTCFKKVSVVWEGEVIAKVGVSVIEGEVELRERGAFNGETGLSERIVWRESHSLSKAITEVPLQERLLEREILGWVRESRIVEKGELIWVEVTHHCSTAGHPGEGDLVKTNWGSLRREFYHVGVESIEVLESNSLKQESLRRGETNDSWIIVELDKRIGKRQWAVIGTESRERAGASREGLRTTHWVIHDTSSFSSGSFCTSGDIREWVNSIEGEVWDCERARHSQVKGATCFVDESNRVSRAVTKGVGGGYRTVKRSED